MLPVGNAKTFTCITGSSNPVSSMLWKKGKMAMATGETSYVQIGDYGGEVLQSTYTFTPQRSDNGVSVTCTPIWKGSEYTQYTKNVNLNVTCKLHQRIVHDIYPYYLL